MTRLLARTGFLLGLLAAPAIALADYGPLNEAVNAVGGLLPSLSNFTNGSLCDSVNGSCGVAAIASVILLRFRPLLTVIGIICMMIAGIRMILGQEDDGLEKSRAVISACIAGIMLAYLIEPFLAAFYGQSGSVEMNPGSGVIVLSTEVQGVINWVLVIAAVLAVFMIILSAFKALKYANVTSEEGVTNLRKAVLYICAGVLILAFRLVLANTIANDTRNPVGLLLPAVVLINYLMGFFALASVCVVIYAGIQLVLSWGNEESLARAKSILIRTIIGTIIILVSWSLVHFVIEPGIS